MAHNHKKIQSDLARARGLGAGHSGVTHWWHQRVTALSNFVLMLWLVWSVVTINGWSYEDFTFWLQQPVNAILMIFAVISVFYHALLGTQVIAEDYLHHEGLKFMKLLGLRFFFIGGAVACIFCICKIAF